jgi:hypothetical protein
MHTLEKVNLFWDVDRTTLDITTHQHFIIERILERGDIDDFHFAKDTYGVEALKEVVLTARSLDRRSLYFWQNYFSLPSSACTPTSSLKTHSAFWTK